MGAHACLSHARSRRGWFTKVLTLGLLSSVSCVGVTDALAQQPAPPPAWSPHPYQAPSAEQSNPLRPNSGAASQSSAQFTSQPAAHATAPTATPSTGHVSTATTPSKTGAQESLVQRWRKTDRTQRDVVAPAAYTQSLQRTAEPMVQPSVATIESAPANPRMHPQPDRLTQTTANSSEPQWTPMQWSQVQRPAANQPVASTNTMVPHGSELSNRAEPAKFSAAQQFAPIDQPVGPRLNLIPAGPNAPAAVSTDIQLAAFQQSENGSASSAGPVVSNAIPTSEPAPWTERTESRPSNRGSVQGVKPNRAPSSLLTRQQSPAQEPALGLPPAGLPPAVVPQAVLPQAAEPPAAEPPAVEPPAAVPQATLPSLPPTTNEIAPPVLPSAPKADDTRSTLPKLPSRDPIIVPPFRDSVPVPPATELSRPEPIVPNPFPQRQPDSMPPERLPASPSDRSVPDDSVFGDDDLPPMPPTRQNRSIANCDEVRNFAMNTDIKNVRVDSSPGFVQGYQGRDRINSYTKESYVEKAPSRTWYDYDGQVIAQGRLIDLVFGTALIEQADGTRTSYLLRKLSDGDQAYIAEVWGVPVTCSLGDQGFEARMFADSTFTWKATGACHKPLYFEDVQLERYGHEWGPIVQPAISTLNFFGSVALLPYNMGIHPMNECQYPLGYYRPGSCAPWTLGPIPISLRGALSQASVVTGTAWAVP
ncbi:MAG: hypothetical protein ACK52S_16015 [Pirellula sp.]